MPNDSSPAKTKEKRAVQRLPRSKRMAEIMAVTRGLIAAGGYRNLLTLDIAKACGITEGAIFRYFPSKRDLMSRVCEEWFGEMIEASETLIQYASPYERLWHAVAHHLTEIRREPELSRFVLMELRYESDYRSSRLYQLNRIYTGRIKNALQAAINAGMLRDDLPVSLLRNMVFGTIEHETWSFLLAENRAEDQFDVDTVTNQIVGVIWRGMAPESETDRNVGRSARIDRSIDRLESLVSGLVAEERKNGMVGNDTPRDPPGT